MFIKNIFQEDVLWDGRFIASFPVHWLLGYVQLFLAMPRKTKHLGHPEGQGHMQIG